MTQVAFWAEYVTTLASVALAGSITIAGLCLRDFSRFWLAVEAL
jgi:hypothetical protein